MTLQDIKDYIIRNDYTVNPTVILSMIDSLEVKTEEVKLPEVNFTSDQLLYGATAINSDGEVIKGNCLYNGRIPIIPKETKWVTKDELPDGTSAIVQVGTSLVLIKK